MGRVKTSKLKRRLGKALRQNRPVPVFVAVKTARRVRQNPLRRNWRTSKLKLGTPHARKELAE
ncbi:MAG: 50S ribosomal protein L39e [Candidatus Micrarchaeia archaeon]